MKNWVTTLLWTILLMLVLCIIVQKLEETKVGCVDNIVRVEKILNSWEIYEEN